MPSKNAGTVPIPIDTKIGTALMIYDSSQYTTQPYSKQGILRIIFSKFKINKFLVRIKVYGERETV